MLSLSRLAILATFAAAVLAAYLGRFWESAYTLAGTGSTLAELTTVPLNGQDHVVTIRSNLVGVNETEQQQHVVGTEEGKDVVAQNTKDIPVLLILHGGPGATDIPFLHTSDNLLEDHFVVVHYDQRTAGKTCKYFHDDGNGNNAELVEEAYTVQQHVNDAIAMIDYLRKRFQQDKIYVLGGSWGSILAMLLARNVPHYLHHVAVRGLCVNVAKSEQISYDFVASQFPEFREVVPQLPPYGGERARVNDMIEQRKWLKLAGGMSYKCRQSKCSRMDLELGIIKALLSSKEMSWADLARFKKCFVGTLHHMWGEVEQYDALRDVPLIDVPLVVLHGRHDYCTAHTLVEDYFNKLQAPRKTLYWFEESGHSPQQEEPELFQRRLIAELLGKTE
jgi:pimeloyl-ACP methyl ester carboxylesterase